MHIPPVCRSASPAAMAAASATLSERRPGRIGIDQPGIGRGVDLRRDARRFAPEQEDVIRSESEVEIGQGRRGGEQHDTAALRLPPRLEIQPRGVPSDCHGIEIVHSGTAEGAIGGREPGRLDYMRLDAEAGAQPQNGAGVLRNIGLIKRYAHGMI